MSNQHKHLSAGPRDTRPGSSPSTTSRSGRPRETTLGPATFHSKRDAETYLRQLLECHQAGLAIIGEDEDILRALAGLHPEQERVVGRGIERFTVMANANYPGSPRTFVVRHVDGTWATLSYRIPFENAAVRQAKLVNEALRNTVQDQIDVVRRHTLALGANARCSLTGEPLARGEFEIDHTGHEFATLAHEWLLGRVELGEEVLIYRDAQGRMQLVLAHQRREWSGYHELWAVLQPVSVEAHRAKSADSMRSRRLLTRSHQSTTSSRQTAERGANV
jgi:hypothetical protein